MWRALALLCLCLMTSALARAAPADASIWVALSAEGPSYRAVANVLRVELEKRDNRSIDWVVAPWAELIARRPLPDVLVTVGTQAWNELARSIGERRHRPAMIATLLPMSNFVAALPIGDRMRTSAVVLDQPPTRYSRLVRLLLPRADTVSIMLGPDTREQGHALLTAMQKEGIQLRVTEVSADTITGKLPAVFKESDALLAIADPEVINSQTVPYILSASYRWLLPVVGFSPGLVQAGALAGLYAKPEHIGAATATRVWQAIQGRTMDPPGAPPEFSVAINSSVARSLGLILNEAEVQRTLTALERGSNDRVRDREAAP